MAEYGRNTDTGAEQQMLGRQATGETAPDPPASKSPGPDSPVLPPPVAPPWLVPDRNAGGTRGQAQQNRSTRDEPVPDRNAPKPDPL